MNNKINKITIISSKGNIFDTKNKYIIPLYQRSFEWEEKQLIQLVEDIEDITDDTNYYIGSLIVSKQKDYFEIVDGQQRLTSLYLLMSCLGIKLKATLSFACRDKSNYTLTKIQQILNENTSEFDQDYIEEKLGQGIRILKEKIEDEEFDKDVFLEKLKRVIIYRIEVPENTNLNRYFEIMNTRGEQLEQHDILKATLMSYLPNNEQAIFAKIWEACSDMTGYVQMHFNVEYRQSIFENEWKEFLSIKWSDLKKIEKLKCEKDDGFSIVDIVKKDFCISFDEVTDENDNRIRFESIIEFPYFLLHVLKVFVRLNSIKGEGSKELLNELLDDKKLLNSFNNIVENGVMRDKKISNDKKNFSRRFIVCLLKSRYLFDKYIIKREYTINDSNGEWSLKEMRVSGQPSKKRPHYVNTRFRISGERESTNNKRTKTNIMIQSALRVSYTSPKVMHWITTLLYWLSKNNYKNIDDATLVEYDAKIEDIAISAVIENFFNIHPDDDYTMGVNTPHIVFNYLDFLIWKQDDKKYKDFVFEFRNSIEHWYPQNPSEGTFEQWSDGVHRFGNLCLIQRNINSKFSNMSPEAKKSTFYKMIAKGSLKLRIMSELTENNGRQLASSYWKEKICKEHEEEMVCILKKACGIE